MKQQLKELQSGPGCSVGQLKEILKTVLEELTSDEPMAIDGGTF
jgi:hypothetical protein